MLKSFLASLFLGASLMASAATPGLSAFIIHKIEKGEWTPPASPSASFGKVEKISSEEGTLKERLALFSAQLAPEAKVEWTVQRLPELFWLPPGQTLRRYDNNHWIWALDAKSKKRLMGFRSVNTTTGCSSGCNPLFYTLVFDDNGQILKILEDPEHPLQKIGHAPMNEADKKNLLDIARKLPEALHWLGSSSESTQEGESFPPQTWTLLKPWIVEGAAYSSFRVFETALQIQQAIRAQPKAWDKETDKLNQTLSEALGVENVGEARKLLGKWQKQIKSPQTPRRLRALDQELYLMLSEWLLQKSYWKNDELKKVLADSGVEAHRPSLLCHFYKNMVSSDEGAALFIKVESNFAQWPRCSENLSKFLGLMARVKLQQALKESEINELSQNEWPEWILSDANLLLRLTQVLQKNSQDALAQQALAQLTVRFPKFSIDAPALQALMQSKDFASASAKVQTLYRAELARTLLNQPIAWPAIEVKIAGKKQSLPIAGKRIYIFFANWCPHCQKLFAALGKGLLPAKLLSQVQFIESFNDAQDLAPATKLCSDSKLPAKLCREMALLPTSQQAPDFHNALSLYSIPRILIANEHGQISSLNVSLDFDDASEKDPARDLEWLLDSQP